MTPSRTNTTDTLRPEPSSGGATTQTTAHEVREIVARQGRLSVPLEELSDSSDLHSAGLTSLATVSLMLALEEHFDIEFPDSLLSRKTFSSITALSAAVDGLQSARRTTVRHG